MAGLGIVLMIAGGIAAAIGGLWLLIKGFEESAMWGIGMLLVPFVGLIFVITHWEQAKKPFLYNLLGSIVFFIGFVMIGAGHRV